MNCEYCENDIPAGKPTCPFCGAAVKGYVAPVVVPGKTVPIVPQEQANETNGDVFEKSPQSRTVFLLLGIFFGLFGLQLLYVRRFRLFTAIVFAWVLGCLFEEEGIFGLIFLVSFIATCFITTDGRNRKLR